MSPLQVELRVLVAAVYSSLLVWVGAVLADAHPEPKLSPLLTRGGGPGRP